MSLEPTAVAETSAKELPLVHAFVAVVAAGSFTKAAKRSGIDKSLLSRRVQALEDHLGVRLLQRTTRKIYVTDAGTSLYAAVADPLDSVAAALQRAAQPDELSGRLRVATLPAIAQEIVVPAVATMLQRHPAVAPEVRATDTMVDLIEEGIDVAIRVGRLADSSLVSRKLGTWSYTLCASPKWLAEHPEATTPESIADHWILYSDVPHSDLWQLESDDDRVQLRVRPLLVVDDGETQLEAVRQGLGVSSFLPTGVHAELREGSLVRVLPQWRVTGEYGIWAVYPHRALLPQRVREFIDIVAAQVAVLTRQWRAYTG